jgi:hypothetical protein
MPTAMCMICALLDTTGVAVCRSLSVTNPHLITLKYRGDCTNHFPEHREIHIFLLRHSLPICVISLFMPSHFRFNTLWLAVLYYANPNLFHYFLWEYHFLIYTPLLQEHNEGNKQQLCVRGDLYIFNLSIAISTSGTDGSTVFQCA